jgi:cytochrome c biogenesis protein
MGGLISLITGQRGYIVLENGQSTSEVTLYDENTIPLGFELKLDDFQVEFYEDYKNRPKSYTSFVTVKNPDETVFDVDIRVNHPLMHNGFTIYQSSYGIPEWARSYSAADDTALVEVKLTGAPDGMPPVATFGMVMGEYYFIPGFGDSIKIGLAEFHRDFEQIQSVSGEPNPAVKINVVVHNKIRWSVYAFKNFPGMNMPMSQDLEFLFVMKDINEDRSENIEYYTVLGVVKDRGTLPMWIAAFMIMVGLTFTFYIRPKRIWVYDDNGKILIGGRTKGDPDPLRKLIHKTIKNI